MPSIKLSHSLRALLTALCLALCLLPCFAWGEDDEDTLDLFNAFQETSSTASRAPKPLSQTAENVTVVTAKEIEQLNAHTLADILDTIPGIQIQHNGGPGITAYTYIQSANPFFSQIFIDGISLNNLGNNFPDISLISVQSIDRVEIVKGAASSAWGSALGGVINVITKAPEQGRSISGSATASIGERTTTDTRAELSGTVDKLGYYLSGGYLGSDGLLPTMQIGSRYAYAKLNYDIPNSGQMWGTFSYNHAGMGDLFAQGIDLKERQEKLIMLASLGLRYTLAEGLDLEITGNHSFNSADFSYFYISDGSPRWLPDRFREQVSGGSAKLVWHKDNNLLAIGSDYKHQEAKYIDVYSRKVDRWGVYLNDTLALGPVSITPGVRLDHTQTSGDQVSSSLGITWQVTDKTLLRAYTGRGYNVPILIGTDGPSIKIWTNQIGAESTAIPYLWVKGTLFRNITWGSGVEQHLAMGSELEVRTVPVFNTSLGAGWTYTETTRTSDGSEVRPDRPVQTLKLALRYDDHTYRGVLTGKHIYWNSMPDQNGRYGGLIWDLHLGATILKRENNSLELFFSGHNLFNGTQHNNELIPNTGRWFEGGMRVRF